MSHGHAVEAMGSDDDTSAVRFKRYLSPLSLDAVVESKLMELASSGPCLGALIAQAFEFGAPETIRETIRRLECARALRLSVREDFDAVARLVSGCV